MNSSNHMISVIVSIYNGEKYISECIESIINQTYKNFELFLVDDGSSDKSGEIIDNFSKLDTRIIAIHKNNSGVSASRNIALDRCNGEYVCIVDQDDILNDDYLEYFYNLLVKTNCDVAYTPEVDKFFANINNSIENNKFSILTGKEAAINMLYHKIVIAPWNKMIKKSLIDDYKIRFNENFFNGEGFAFSIGCFVYAKNVVCGYKKVYHYRVGDPQTGASKYKKEYLISSITAQKYIRDEYLKNDKSLIKAWKYSNWHTHCDAFNVMVGCNAKKCDPSLYKMLKREIHAFSIKAIFAPVNLNQRFRALMFTFNAYLSAKVINRFRIRKFSSVNKKN